MQNLQEGIEYCWGHAKAFYRRSPMSCKRGRENFKQLVRLSTCPESQLTIEITGKFAGRARVYICTYHRIFEAQLLLRRQQQLLEQATASAAADDDVCIIIPPSYSSEDQGLLYPDIERLSKRFKSHRSALDFDRGFVNGTLKEAKVKEG
jgi:predicted RNA-binding protein YlxR (DUF448 family)